MIKENIIYIEEHWKRLRRGKDQSRFHALLAPYTINFDPPKLSQNDLKRSRLHLTNTCALSFKVW